MLTEAVIVGLRRKPLQVTIGKKWLMKRLLKVSSVVTLAGHDFRGAVLVGVVCK
jgi:hypothetical protein